MHTKDTFSYTINVGGQLLDLSEPQVMGILNVTPDSFYNESRRQTEQGIAQRVRQIVEEGGSIIDIGAYSTRPGAQEVSKEEEFARLHMALDIVRREIPKTVVISIDTFRAGIAESIADEFGPIIVNDVSGGADPGMFAVVSRLGLPYILTHSPLGILSTTSSPLNRPFPTEEFMPSVLLYLSQRIDTLLQLGQKDIILDPGFGFGKSLDENYELLMQLDVLHTFRLPLLVGISRKSMIFRLLSTSPEEALNGTTVLNTLAIERGASILRVHDVSAATEVIKIVRKCSSPLV